MSEIHVSEEASQSAEWSMESTELLIKLVGQLLLRFSTEYIVHSLDQIKTWNLAGSKMGSGQWGQMRGTKKGQGGSKADKMQPITEEINAKCNTNYTISQCINKLTSLKAKARKVLVNVSRTRKLYKQTGLATTELTEEATDAAQVCTSARVQSYVQPHRNYPGPSQREVLALPTVSGDCDYHNRATFVYYAACKLDHD